MRPRSAYSLLVNGLDSFELSHECAYHIMRRLALLRRDASFGLVVRLVPQPQFGTVDSIQKLYVLGGLGAQELLDNGLRLGVGSKRGLIAFEFLKDAAMRLTRYSLHIDDMETLACRF